MTDLATMLVVNKAVEIAKNALKKGLSIEFIADITGLDNATIEALQDELQDELDNE